MLSGGPASVYDEGAPALPPYVIASGLPVLGICYGMQLLAQALGGRVAPAARREYGHAVITLSDPGHALLRELPPTMPVWMSALRPHRRAAAGVPRRRPLRGLPRRGDGQRRGLPRHPVPPGGGAHPAGQPRCCATSSSGVAGCAGGWTASSFIGESVDTIARQVGGGRVICALSGGVDSAVAASLGHAAVGDQLTCIFVDNGLLRAEEPERVVNTFRGHMAIDLRHVEAAGRFLGRLAGVTNPETKRIRIGETFIRVFEEQGPRHGRGALPSSRAPPTPT